MDSALLIIIAANIISILTGIIFLLVFFAVYKKNDFKTARNYLIGAFIFIVVDPLLIWHLGKSLSAYGSESVFNFSNLTTLK